MDGVTPRTMFTGNGDHNRHLRHSSWIHSGCQARAVTCITRCLVLGSKCKVIVRTHRLMRENDRCPTSFCLAFSSSSDRRRESITLMNML